MTLVNGAETDANSEIAAVFIFSWTCGEVCGMLCDLERRRKHNGIF